jgi:hypothetical protein
MTFNIAKKLLSENKITANKFGSLLLFERERERDAPPVILNIF